MSDPQTIGSVCGTGYYSAKQHQPVNGCSPRLVDIHLSTPRQKPGYLGSKCLQETTVRNPLKLPEMALLTEKQEN